MKILFIWVRVNTSDPLTFLPLGIGYLGANLPPRHKAVMWDGQLDDSDNSNVLNVIRKVKPDGIGVSVWNFNIFEVGKLVGEIKSAFPDIPIIAGGIAVSAYKTDFFTYVQADYGIAGEGEIPLTQLLDVLSKTKNPRPISLRKIGGLLYRSKGAVYINRVQWEPIQDIKHCDYSLIRFGDYLKKGYYYSIHPKGYLTAPILTTRGCPFPCEFCSARLVNGRVIRQRKISAIIDEMKYLRSTFNVRAFNIIDDNFTMNMAFAKEVVRAILKLGWTDVSFSNPNGVKVEYLDEELLLLMKRAGWQHVYIAPESGSIDTLHKMQKLVKLPVVREKIPIIHKAGLKVYGFFMIGYPGETVSDIHRTIEFARSAGFDSVIYSCFKPLPGTPVYDRLVREGDIKPEPQHIMYYDVTFAPKGMTIGQVKALRLWGLFRFYTSSPKRFFTAATIYPMGKMFTYIRKIVT